MFLQADNTSCILLNDQLVDVAMATIIKPKDRIMHNKQMPEGTLRVSMSRCLPGHEHMVPPYPPDEDMLLGECKCWLMMWPKSQIRLDLSTPKTTPFGPTHGKTSAPLPPSVLVQSRPEVGGPTVMVAAGAEAANEEDNEDHDQYFNMGADIGNGHQDDSPYHGPDTEMHDPLEEERPVECKKSLFVDSQETPQDVFNQMCKESLLAMLSPPQKDQPIKPATMLSPNTLGATLYEAIKGQPKKARKRTKNGGAASSSQPAPKTIRVQDRIPTDARPYHISGQPILPPDVLKRVTGDLRSLHDAVLSTEKRLLSMQDPPYPLFAVKVPHGLGFVEKSPGDVFFLRFDDIYNMFHMKGLHWTLFRLFALQLAYMVAKEQIPNIAVADPYYMRQIVLDCPSGRKFMMEYLQSFMVENKDKEIMLVPCSLK